MTIIKGRVARIESGREFTDGKERAQVAVLRDDGSRYDSFTLINTDGLVLDDDVIVEVRRNNGAVHTSPLAATAEEVAEVARG